ncbi:MAG: hypothetical protein IPP78_08985 [Holophagaceae bacterium]|nr:hypothetical protein [Holophagaceae bacterium]
MKRTLYPTSNVDRRLFWTVALCLAQIPFYQLLGHYWFASAFGLIAVFGIVFLYLFGDQPSEQNVDRYSTVIAQLNSLKTELLSLQFFFEQERKLIVDTENNLRKLQDTKAELEPVVLAQRKTVDAILAAQSGRAASTAWKERAIGFLLGVFASVLGGIVLDSLKR